LHVDRQPLIYMPSVAHLEPNYLHNSHEVMELLVELCHGELHGDACARAAGLDRVEVLQNIVLQGPRRGAPPWWRPRAG